MRGAELSEEAKAAFADGFGEYLHGAIVHVIRYRYAYAVGVAWLIVVSLLTPVDRVIGHRAAALVSAPAPSAQAPAATTASDGSAGAGLTDATLQLAPAPPQPVADLSSPAADAGSQDTAPVYSPADTGPAAEPPSSGSSSPPPAPAGCSTDASLPVPVATTVVSALGTAQTTASQTSGQSPPADVAGTAGGAAGCSSGSAPAAPASATAPAWTWTLRLPVP